MGTMVGKKEDFPVGSIKAVSVQGKAFAIVFRGPAKIKNVQIGHMVTE